MFKYWHIVKKKKKKNPLIIQPEPVSYAAVEEDCTSGLVIDSDKVGTDFVLLHGCPQSCVPNPVEGPIDVLLVLEIFLTGDS